VLKVSPNFFAVGLNSEIVFNIAVGPPVTKGAFDDKYLSLLFLALKIKLLPASLRYSSLLYNLFNLLLCKADFCKAPPNIPLVSVPIKADWINSGLEYICLKPVFNSTFCLKWLSNPIQVPPSAPVIPAALYICFLPTSFILFFAIAFVPCKVAWTIACLAAKEVPPVKGVAKAAAISVCNHVSSRIFY